MIRLSIILPVYNVEPFLPTCLDSLLAQDIDPSEYEIICVNDGSTDGSETIIRQYQEEHNNIKLISVPNGGVSRARNIGLAASTGEFVWFIDPDDFIRPNCLGFILSSVEKENADLCNIHFVAVEESSALSSVEIASKLSYRTAPQQLGSCWGHIVRHPNVPTVNENLHYGEDYLWEFEACAASKKQITISPALYYYRQRSGSAMHSRTKEKTQKHIEDMHQLALCYKRFLSEEKYRDWGKNLEDRIGLCVQSMLNSMLRNHYGKAEIQSTIQTLKAEQLYPYKPLWFLLKPQSSIKCSFLNIYLFLMRNEKFVFFIHSLKG